MEVLQRLGWHNYYILPTVILVFIVGGTQGIQHCYECLDNEMTSFCNRSSSLQQCQSDKDMCHTTVSVIGGRLFTKKGCILTELCQAAMTTNTEECETGVVRSTCTFCCIGDECNYDRFKYAAPGIPTTLAPTTPPTTALSTVLPSRCENENLTRCTKDYEEAILVAMKDPRTNFPYFCRQVPVIFQCIAEAMASCCEDNQLALHDQLNAVSDVMWSRCPRECEVTEGDICVKTTLEKVIAEVITGPGSCEKLRRVVIELQKCITINVGTCGQMERISFQTQVKVIKDAVQLICVDLPTESPPVTSSPTDVTTVPPSVGCDVGKVEQCLVDLALNLTQGDTNYDNICSMLLPQTQECYDDNTFTCPDSTKERLEHAFNFTIQLMPQNCSMTTEAPPTCDTTAARTCAVEIWRIIDEVGDYGLACGMVEQTVDCVLANVTGCTYREKVSLNRTLDIVLKTLEGKCDAVAEVEGNCTNIELTEGGKEWTMKFHSNYDPAKLCQDKEDCKIFLELDIENTDKPKCQDGSIIPQIKCRPEKEPETGPPCGALITSDNWKDTHSVHLAATVDKKIDGNQKVKVTLKYKKVIKGQVSEVMTLDECQIRVIDHDTTGQCQSLNDPHIKTFDGQLYDNFLEGVFTLYKHTTLPCEVQVLYQKCGRQATCNCGVAVKSGDYVFFADICRRKKTSCGKRSKCKDLLKAKSFVWDEVTPGTRLFSHPDGYEVLLPHGTLVIIQYHKKLQLINVMVTPSSADYKKTTGLCGVYDGDINEDLLLPDGTLYTEGNLGQHKHPVNFCKAWRVDRDNWLVGGAPYEPYHPPKYCVCDDKSCLEVSCHARHLVSTCDINTEGEILFDDVPKVKPAEGQGQRQKRAIGDKDDFDFDTDFTPKEIDPSTRQWTEIEARKFCQAYMDGSNIARLCQFQAGVEVLHYVNICVQDILLSDETKYAISALEGMKSECVNVVQTDSRFADSDTNKHVVVQIDKANCPLECSEHGTCDEGKCLCKEGYVGLACDVRRDAKPSYVSTDFGGLCNSRVTDCSNIVVYADDIIKSDMLTCHIRSIKITEEGISNSTYSHQKTHAHFISSNQVLCRVNTRTLNQAFYIDLSNDGVHVSGEPVLYVAHDPSCFDCQLNDDQNGATCARKADSCIADGKCFRSGESERNDACSICDPSSSMNALKKMKSIACLGPFAMIIIAGVLIVVITILALLLWYCCCKRPIQKLSFEKSKMEEGIANELLRRGR